MSTLFTAGLDAMRRADLQLNASASNLARISVEGAPAVRVTGDTLSLSSSEPDIATEMVGLTQAKTQFKAGTTLVRTGSEMMKSLLDLFG